MAEQSSRTSLGEGAAQEAPTAPHATPRRDSGPRTGPERFWAHWPVRLALAASLVVSGLAHCAVVPFDVPPDFEVKDVEGEAAIPIDVLQGVDEPPPPASPPAEPEPKAQEQPDKSAEAARQAARLAQRDAGAPDAASDGLADAVSDAGADGSWLDGAVASNDDAGAGAGQGPRDPQAILGAAGDIQADKVLVMLVVNAEVIRQNPEGAKMGFLLRGIKQWNDFMNGTDIDPLRDADWLMISGPSLVNTSRDVVLIHYSAPDAKIERAMDQVARNYSKGGSYDAGVPGAKAVTSYADDAERVVMRPRPHVLAVVPPSVAQKVAHQLAHALVPPHIRKGEAMYLRVWDPHHPMPAIPQSITEARMRIVPRDDEGADVYVDGDTKDAPTAAQAAEDVKALVGRYQTWYISAATHGLVDHIEVTSEGPMVRVHVTATREQIATVIGFVAGTLGVAPPPNPAPSAHP